ncbi:alpha/beta hydrolase [Marinilabiliaceae bacterium JC017]|nr:alpha/beta hydrolase [Marinilabiliaceae bacterium JC017]
MNKTYHYKGTDINYHQSGSGPSVVLLHGYLENHKIWLPYLNILKDYQVIIPDLPGHGKSGVLHKDNSISGYAQIITELLSTLNIKNYSIISHSMGGYVALEMTHKYPENIQGLVLISTHPYTDSPQKQLRRQKEIDFIHKGKKKLLIQQHLMQFSNLQQRELIKEMTQEISDEGMIANLENMKNRQNHLSLFLNPPCKACYLWGENDTTIDLKKITNNEFTDTKVKYKIIHQGGHLLVITHLNLIASYLQTALNLFTRPDKGSDWI